MENVFVFIGIFLCVSMDLAKLPYGNDKFNGEEKTLEDLTKSHVGTDRESNVNLCKPPVTHVHGGVVIQADQVYSTDTEITHICKDGFEMKGDSKQRCLSNGLWEGDVPVCIEKKWYKNPYIWIIIGLVFSNTSVLFICCVCKRGREQHTTTYNKCEIEEKGTETERLDEQTDLVGEAESAVPELCKSVELVINTEEEENLRSTPTSKVVLPRPSFVSSTGTMKTNVTTTDDESTSANYPAKEENEPKQATDIEAIQIGNTSMMPTEPDDDSKPLIVPNTMHFKTPDLPRTIEN